MFETFISVDIEASGPIPGEYSMLALGACVVGATDKNFYVELKPLSKNFDARALAVAGFDMEQLEREGIEPHRAMAEFDRWLKQVTPRDSTPVFCGFPLAFDWMFVAYYFHRFLRRNPFGYSGFDFKSYSMGLRGAQWEESPLVQQPDFTPALTHNAREDAIVQAELLERLFKYANERPTESERTNQ